MKSSSSVTPLELKAFELRNIIKVIQDAKQRDEKRKLKLHLAQTREERDALQYRFAQEMQIERAHIEHLKEEFDCVQKYKLEHSNHNSEVTEYNDNNNDSNNQLVSYKVPTSSSGGGSGSRFNGQITTTDLQRQREMNFKFERIAVKSENQLRKSHKESQSVSEQKQVSNIYINSYIISFLLTTNKFYFIHLYQHSFTYYNKNEKFCIDSLIYNKLK